jgi:hypothetical protein
MKQWIIAWIFEKCVYSYPSRKAIQCNAEEEGHRSCTRCYLPTSYLTSKKKARVCQKKESKTTAPLYLQARQERATFGGEWDIPDGVLKEGLSLAVLGIHQISEIENAV